MTEKYIKMAEENFQETEDTIRKMTPKRKYQLENLSLVDYLGYCHYFKALRNWNTTESADE